MQLVLKEKRVKRKVPTAEQKDLLEEIANFERPPSPPPAADDNFADILEGSSKSPHHSPFVGRQGPKIGLVQTLLFGDQKKTKDVEVKPSVTFSGPSKARPEDLSTKDFVKIEPRESEESESVKIVRQHLREMRQSLAEQMQEFADARQRDKEYFDSIVKVSLKFFIEKLRKKFSLA